MEAIMKMYRDRLTDLTKRNKSLRLMRLTQKDHFDLHVLDKHDENKSAILDAVCQMKTSIPLIAANNFDEEGIMINQKLTKLKREIDLIEQETGSNPFYVAYGFLEGYLVEDFFLRSPLLLYPAKLKRKLIGNLPYWVLEMEEDETPFLNRTFLLAAQKFLGVNLVDLMESELADLPKDREQVSPYLADLLRRYKITVTEEETSIQPFQQMKAAEIPKEMQGYKIRPYAVIGKFQQSTSTLLGDYDALLNDLPAHGLLHELFNGTESDEIETVETDELNKVHEGDTHFVLETDASQEAVVIAARNRKGLIVHGPPGTGKSQVIVNLIADRMALGQRVLLVCQKPAALDVVYNRLSSIDLHKHVALLHDFNKSKQTVYGKLSSVLERPTPTTASDHRKISQEMQSLAERLNKIANSLHRVNEFGRTMYFLYSHAKWDENWLLDVSDLLPDLTYEQLQEQLAELRVTFELMQRYDHPNHPWANRKNFANLQANKELELKGILKQMLDDVLTGSEIRLSTELHYPPAYYLQHADAVKGLEQAIRILQNNRIYQHVLQFYQDEEREFEHEAQFQKVKQTYGSLSKQLDILAARPEPVTHLTEQEAELWNNKIRQFLDLNEKKLARLVSPAWYGLRKEVQAHCQNAKIPFDGHSVRQYREKIEAFLGFEKLRKEAQQVFLYKDSPVLNELEEWKKWIRQKKHALDFLELFVQAHSVLGDWLSIPQTKEDLQDLLRPETELQIKRVLDLAERTARLQSDMKKLEAYLQAEEAEALLKEVNQGIYDVDRFRAMLNSLDQFDSLCRLDQMKTAMDGFQQKLIERCSKKAGIAQTTNLVEHWSALIENSFLHAWILQVEEQEPHLKDVSTEIFGSNLTRYRQLLAEKRRLVPRMIDEKLIDRSRETAPASRRKLKGEAGKKRRQASLRQVMNSFTDDLLNLVPCWLCTPESVSAIFPLLEGMFDLVIFDEASQCPVENAVPAIYRAKQLVVAGDEKQLPPSSFFKSTADDGDENAEDEEDIQVYTDKTDTEAKSLLEWSKPRLADQWLTWHYRSRYEELINFSNYAFYGNRMQISPRVSKESGVRPIEFVMTNGRWIGNQNRVEAEKTVDAVLEILQNDPAKPSIGIIAFNKNQADLINDELEKRAVENPEAQLLIDEARQRKNGEEHVGLFVKNIENVQGDERDIMIFSVAYAKNEEGKMPSVFGPLSQAAGENRLNVAITRAKLKVILICSFDPTEWVRAETYAKGVRLFKKYLEYGKAVSEGNQELVKSILEGVLDSTTVQDLDEQIKYDSVFEQEVREALMKKGYEVHTQIGFSGYKIDLGVIDPVTKENYILGIECDGAMYHSSKVARERDLYRQRFLEKSGWKIHRVWSRNWWKTREKELEKIQEAIEQAKQKRARGTQQQKLNLEGLK